MPVNVQQEEEKLELSDIAHEWLLSYMLRAKNDFAASSKLPPIENQSIIHEMIRVFQNVAVSLGYKSWAGFDFSPDMADEKKKFWGDLSRYTRFEVWKSAADLNRQIHGYLSRYGKFKFWKSLYDFSDSITVFIDFSRYESQDAADLEEEFLHLLSCQHFAGRKVDLNQYSQDELYSSIAHKTPFIIEPGGTPCPHEDCQTAFIFTPTAELDPIARASNEKLTTEKMNTIFRMLWDHQVSVTKDTRRYKGDNGLISPNCTKTRLQALFQSLVDSAQQEMEAAARMLERGQNDHGAFDQAEGTITTIQTIQRDMALWGCRNTRPSPESKA